MGSVRLRGVVLGLTLAGPSACIFWDTGDWSTNFGQHGLTDGSTDAPGSTDAGADVPSDSSQGDSADTQAPSPISVGQFAMGGSLDGGNVLTGSFLEPVSGGDTIVVVAYFSNTPGLTLTGISDNAGNHYKTKPPIMEYGGAASALLAYAANVDGGTITVSTNFANATVTGAILINEYAGLDPNDPLDSYDASTGTGMMVNSGDVQTQWAHELLFAFAQSDSSLSSSPSPGFTIQATGTGTFDEYQVVTDEGTYSAAFASPESAPLTPWVSLIASFH